MSIIFIAGLERSGTTFLQTELLRYHKVVALGEVAPTVRAILNLPDTSSKWKIALGLKSQTYWNPSTYHEIIERVKNDSFWAPLYDNLKTFHDMQTAIEYVYETAMRIYPGYAIVDSSKYVGHLERIARNIKFNNQVIVLFCIRDYRGWLLSIKKHQQRTGIHKRNALIEIYKWMYSNKKLLTCIKKYFNNYKVVSYEKLMFCYDEVMPEISKTCKLGGEQENINLSNFHEIMGSQSLRESVISDKRNYDFQWFSYLGYGLFELPVKLFNREIYRNKHK